jgi:hypothetical protein
VGRTHRAQVTIVGDAALQARYDTAQNDVFVLPDDIYQRLSSHLTFGATRKVEGWVVDGPKQVTYWIAAKSVPSKVAQP